MKEIANNRIYTVYIHVNMLNQKKYVGITSKEPKQRWKNGNGYLSSALFYNAIKKYSWNCFEHLIIAQHLTKEEAEQMEIELIKQYKTTDIRYGYNIENGGNTLGTHSEYTKRKISKANRGKFVSYETREKMSNANKGKHHTLETKNKMSESKKGELNPMYGAHHTEESKEKISNAKKGVPLRGNSSRTRKIVQLDLDGNFIAKYDCIRDASEKYDVDASNIGKVCRCVQNTAYGYKWMYYGDYIKMIGGEQDGE